MSRGGGTSFVVLPNPPALKQNAATGGGGSPANGQRVHVRILLSFFLGKKGLRVCERWTWDASSRLNIAAALAGSDWCDRLERAGPDALAGKVLCVCAALGVAGEVARGRDDPAASEALALLAAWIDDPTEERFDHICGTIFGPGERPELGPHGVVWCALRTATSSVGNGEAGWTLGAVCGAAEQASFGPEAVRSFAEREVLARQRHAEPGAAADGGGTSAFPGS